MEHKCSKIEENLKAAQLENLKQTAVIFPYLFSDEDLERDNENKTFSVHFMRFEWSLKMAAALKQGSQLSADIHHPAFEHTIFVILQFPIQIKH